MTGHPYAADAQRQADRADRDRASASHPAQVLVLGWLMNRNQTRRHRLGPAALSALLAAAKAKPAYTGLTLLGDRLPGLTGEELGWIAAALWPTPGTPAAGRCPRPAGSGHHP